MNGFYSTLALLCAFVYACESANTTITQEATFTVQVGDADAASRKGKFVVGLFGEALPITSLNFAQLCKGMKHGQEKWQYKNTKIFRVVPDFLIQMGDVLYGDGRGGRSVFNTHFIDENFNFSHGSAGMVAMANEGVEDSNGSQFYITLGKVRWLDKKNVVFGKVVKGMDFVQFLGGQKVHKNTAVPIPNLKITDCQLKDLKIKYDLKTTDLTSDKDIHPSDPKEEQDWKD